jgi:hypothetical protein
MKASKFLHSFEGLEVFNIFLPHFSRIPRAAIGTMLWGYLIFAIKRKNFSESYFSQLARKPSACHIGTRIESRVPLFKRLILAFLCLGIIVPLFGGVGGLRLRIINSYQYSAKIVCKDKHHAMLDRI